MAISSQILETDEKKGGKKPDLHVLSKSRPWIRNFLTGMVLLIVLGIFVRVGFSALVVTNQRNLDKTINMISDASDVNRSLRFNISELESAPRIYGIAFGSTEELLDKENGLYGLGMVEPSEVKYLTADPPVSPERWKDAAVSETNSSGNG